MRMRAAFARTFGANPELNSEREQKPSPRPISTGRLNTLPCVHLRPIYLVVCEGPYSISDGRPHLGASFALRCLQRLSLPHVANQPCRWRDNWHTRGASAPVLSYWGQLPSSLLRPRRIGTELSHAHDSRITAGADYTFTLFTGAGVLWVIRFGSLPA